MVDSGPSIPLWENLRILALGEQCEWLADLGEKITHVCWPRIDLNRSELGTQWSGVEKRGSEEQYRWRNMSYFFARLSEEGKDDLNWISALRWLDPNRRMSKKVPGWSGFLAGHVLGAAQWIIPEGHGAWVWKKCLEPLPPGKTWEDARLRWRPESRDVWKAAFVELSELRDDTRVSGEAIEDAKKAVEVMQHLEAEI